MFVHINREDITQFPTDHNGVSSIDENMTIRRIVSPNDIEKTGA